MPTNFDLAPPPKVLPGTGITAVPIDIQHIDATITLDAIARSATGTASVQFVSGPLAGSPVFDLRQPISDVRLDGASLGPAGAPLRDLGGGADAQMRVLGATVPAGTTHTLGVDYDVGTPQSPNGGSYPPALVYSPGPAVRLSFGFTDLFPARYLESWVPSNLVFDQFTLRLVVQVIGTAIPHTVVTNGSITALGSNHWQVEWPERTTALSTLFELHATSSLQHDSSTVALPTGAVTIDAWKRTGGPANLATELGRLATWLSENAADIGPYPHGDRFVAYLNVGGMEYDGGTTSGLGPLRHETHHSWWGRGHRPAGQPDGWIDEGWTTYHDLGGNGSEPFDFTDQPVTLCNRNSWSRVTPGAAYAAGAEFFDGVASAMGVAPLKTAMADHYARSRQRPSTTAALEEHLLARSGRPELVDAFHHFVYGFGDQSPGPDLWLRDDPADTGAEPWAGRFWDSPDLWVRNADDGGLAHQNPEFGQDNWFHARVRNRGPGAARHFVVTFAVANFAGVEFTYPSDWLPAMVAVAGFDLPAGSQRVVTARWPRHLLPPAGSHPCWLAAVLTQGDRPPVGAHTWQRNGLAQKNLAVVDLRPNVWLTLPFIVPGLTRGISELVLELRRPQGAVKLDAHLVHRAELRLPGAAPFQDQDGTDAGRGGPMDASDAGGRLVVTPERAALPFPDGARSEIRIPAPRSQIALSLRLRTAERLTEELAVDLVLREAGDRRRVLGGLAVRVQGV